MTPTWACTSSKIPAMQLFYSKLGFRFLQKMAQERSVKKGKQGRKLSRIEVKAKLERTHMTPLLLLKFQPCNCCFLNLVFLFSRRWRRSVVWRRASVVVSLLVSTWRRSWSGADRAPASAGPEKNYATSTWRSCWPIGSEQFGNCGMN